MSTPPSSSASSSSQQHQGRGNNDDEDEILSGPYDGHFGEWYFTKTDAREILIYRLSLLALS
eukprot:CAMPEP_0185854362 /NCGR_PEP_ID=MMETSP1354-20130828/22073_1 /TAXON_ID=708628 /ORGANISM="Erythrolobus madagascarensis, Strain CCMP3276" /LENGTH=61 /DNA_ID=CAMNT_0028556099 /DNA_START=241 /DNA_END=423 /DNA_ORIENTATION=+